MTGPLHRSAPGSRLLGVVAAALALVAALVTGPAVAARSALGATLEPRDLPRVEGKGKVPLFAADAVSGVLFITPDHAQSEMALDAVERCKAELGEAPVRFVTVVSGRYTPAQLQATLARAGRTIPIAFDAGDATAAEMRVQVRPTAAVVDRAGKLVDWQPYDSVGFGDKLCARLRFAAGLIDKAGLDEALDPKRGPRTDPQVAKAARFLKLAERFFERGDHEKAEKTVRQSLATHEPVAAAHVLLGKTLQALKRCPEALVAFDRALELAPEDPDAASGKAACGKN
ncbi:MAG: hypothetical protein EP329_11410 [Deltaproteobacteria bacterium]|nr:MAG: hypothetical protein EP329_11410 [Deltaproteobacteria bacterium]